MSLFSRMVDSVEELVSSVGDAFVDVGDALKQTLDSALSAVNNVLSDLARESWSSLIARIAERGELLGNKFGSWIDAAGAFVSDVFDDLVDLHVKLVDKVVKWAAEVVSVLVETVTEIAETVTSSLLRAVMPYVAAFAGLVLAFKLLGGGGEEDVGQ